MDNMANKFLTKRKKKIIQDDRLYMAVRSCTLKNVTWLVYATLHPYTRPVTLNEEPEAHGHVKLVTMQQKNSLYLSLSNCCLGRK